MTKTYKVTFKPVEPYFFGNEKNFTFPGQKQKSTYSSSYFIRSERVPSQSTILGVLRYIFLPYKWEDFNHKDTREIINNKNNINDKVVGAASFDIDSESIQNFGIIKKISPVFISGRNDFGESVTLIPTPMDHNRTSEKSERVHKASDKEILQYYPFLEYIKVNTTEGKKLYAKDFNVKEGVEHSYVSLEKGELYTFSDLFQSDLRIGINRTEKKDGFFKKEYCMLKKNFSFAVYADIDIDNAPKATSVFLGQGKSAFIVNFTEESNDLQNRVKEFLSRKEYQRAAYPFIYCLSDVFVGDFDNEKVLFCAIDTKDYRAFKTREMGRIEKGGTLYRLLKAGSIIIPENPDEWANKNKKSNAENIGFNTFVILGGKENETECI